MKFYDSICMDFVVETALRPGGVVVVAVVADKVVERVVVFVVADVHERAFGKRKRVGMRRYQIKFISGLYRPPALAKP